VAAGLLAGLVGMIVDNFFGNVSIFFAVPAFLFWWNAGALYQESNQLTYQIRPSTNWKTKILAIVLIGFCLLVIVYFVKRWKQEFYYFQGFKAAKAGQVKKSIEKLEKAYQWFNGEVNSNYELGNSYARHAKMLKEKGLPEKSLQYKEKALEGYLSAIRANPGYDEIYFNIGITHSQLQNKEEAVRYLRMALFINPLLRDVYGTMGNLYAGDKEFGEARKYYQRATEIFPKDKEMWLNLGFILTQLEQHEKAFEAYKTAYKLDIKFIQAYSNLNLAAQKLGRSEPLLEIPILVENVEKNVKSRNYEAARKYAARMVEIVPGNADSHISLGNVLYFLGRHEEAIKVLEKSIELNPTISVAWLNLGQIYQGKGELDLAKEHYQAVLKFDRKNQQAHQYLNALDARE